MLIKPSDLLDINKKEIAQLANSGYSDLSLLRKFIDIPAYKRRGVVLDGQLIRMKGDIPIAVMDDGKVIIEYVHESELPKISMVPIIKIRPETKND